ncbi:MAG: SHOCT domain-containing protein [Nitrosopumilus sp.]|nr:SHOCT domain-containing protein [Nitrosopumilus sp.]
MFVLLGMFTNNVFAEVVDIQVNNKIFEMGDKIEFSGKVEEKSTGIVTIVIRDFNEQFVLLSQATINYDNTFEKSMVIGNEFIEYDTYTATGFILNMSKGVTTEFKITEDNLQDYHHEDSVIIENNVDSENQKIINKIIHEPKSEKLDFVDPSKDPIHYIERYYSEPTYKSWFNRNYPGWTIEEAVGYTDNNLEIKEISKEITDNSIIPNAQASSILEPNQEITDNSDIAQISLAVAGLGILFGAVYGIKRQVDDNSRQISLNKNTIRKKLIRSIIGSNPKEILETRLAKGEISLDEFELLKSKLT